MQSSTERTRPWVYDSLTWEVRPALPDEPDRGFHRNSRREAEERLRSEARAAEHILRIRIKDLKRDLFQCESELKKVYEKTDIEFQCQLYEGDIVELLNGSLHTILKVEHGEAYGDEHGYLKWDADTGMIAHAAMDYREHKIISVSAK